MNKENIIDYVVHTPHNPNKKVLDDMLETLIEENGSPGECDWNTMKNKPFGEEVTRSNILEWDGNTTGLDNIQGALYKVSDVNFESADVLNGGKMTAKVIGTVEGENDTHTDCEITETLVLGENLLDLTAQGLPAIWIQSPDDIGDFYIAFDDADFGGGITLTRGIWLPYRAYPTGTYYISKLEAVEPVFESTVITPLDPKYLPETVATKTFVEELLGGIENGTY